MSLFPWGAALAAAARMGVTPEAFWRLSLKEWRLMTASQDAGLKAADLQKLMMRYPDGGQPDGEDG